MRVWALAALLVVAWAAERVHAHGGGGFRDPSGGVPPGLREPPDPPPPSTGWKSWNDWWRENREPVLQRKARLLADPTIEFGPGAPPSPVRIRRLERARDRAVLPALRHVLLIRVTPWELKSAVLRSLGRCGGPEDAELLVECASKARPGSAERLATLAALARVRVEDRAPVLECAWQMLRGSMRSTGDGVAANLVLGLQGDGTTSRELIAFLRTEQLPEAVSQAVVLALGLIGDPVAREPLESLALEPHPSGLRACALRSLGMIGSDESIPVLLRTFKPTEASEQVLSAAALALGEFPSARHAFPILESCARDFAKRPQLSHCAILALGRLDHPGVVRILLSILEKSKWNADDFAAIALGMRVSRAFRRDRVDDEERARIEKAFAAARKRRSAPSRWLAGILSRNSIETIIRNELGFRLGKEFPPSTVAALASPGSVDVKRLLRDPFYERFDYDTFRAPLDAAGQTAEPTAIPFLVEVLLDPSRSPAQRAAAADALGRIADVRPIDPFVRLRLRSPFPADLLGLDQPAWN
jgi:HEAT repeat protein